MNLLAIDSAGSVLSIAVSRGGEIFCEDTQADMKHSEIVMNCIEKQMARAELKPRDLQGVLCMGGPGSFTGLRIGYSIAKGLALSLSIPFAAVPTLDCIAYSGEHSTESSILIPVIQARKDAFFYTIFRNKERLTQDADASTAQIIEEIQSYANKNEKITVTGPGAEILFNSMSDELKNAVNLNFENRGYAKELITIARNKELFKNDNSAFLYSGPEYIRKTDAEISLQAK